MLPGWRNAQKHSFCNVFRNVFKTILWYYSEQEMRSIADIKLEHVDEHI